MNRHGSNYDEVGELHGPVTENRRNHEEIGVNQKPKLTRMKVILFDHKVDADWQAEPCKIINLHLSFIYFLYKNFEIDKNGYLKVNNIENSL